MFHYTQFFFFEGIPNLDYVNPWMELRGNYEGGVKSPDSHTEERSREAPSAVH